MWLIVFIIIGIVVLVGLLCLIPAVVIACAMVKKRYKLAAITAGATAVAIGLVALCNYIFPTKFPYADSWIYGKTKEQIMGVYGEPAYNFQSMIGYYVGEDNGVLGTGLMDSTNQFFYYIYFGDDNTANEIDTGIQLGG